MDVRVDCVEGCELKNLMFLELWKVEKTGVIELYIFLP